MQDQLLTVCGILPSKKLQVFSKIAPDINNERSLTVPGEDVLWRVQVSPRVAMETIGFEPLVEGVRNVLLLRRTVKIKGGQSLASEGALEKPVPRAGRGIIGVTAEVLWEVEVQLRRGIVTRLRLFR